MARYNAANNWATVLSSAVSSTEAVIGVADASGSPTLPFKITIGDEIMNATAAPSTSSYTVTREQEGTAAAAHAGGAAVENRFTAEVQNDIWDEIDGLAFGNWDGGEPDTNYGGFDSIDGGGV